MWKDEYNIGNELIDNQHKNLFNKCEEFFNSIYSGNADKENCISIIEYVKNYAVAHFSDEELYAQSINYPDLELHKHIHSDFVDTVLIQESILEASNYSWKDIKAFCGILVSWLLFHVISADKKIGTNDRICPKEMAISISSKFPFIDEILNRQVDNKVVNNVDGMIDVKDFEGTVKFNITPTEAVNIARRLTGLDIKEMDELVSMVLSQIANYME